MPIRIKEAREHNLQGVNVEIGDGLTVITGVSGSGKTSLAFDTLYHEARRRFIDVFSLGSVTARLAPANVGEITGLGPAVAVGQNLLNRNPASTLATASGMHPFLRLFYSSFGERLCPRCATPLVVYSEDEIVEQIARLSKVSQVSLLAPLLIQVPGSHATLLAQLRDLGWSEKIILDGKPWNGEGLSSSQPHDLELHVADLSGDSTTPAIRQAVEHALGLGVQAVTVSHLNGKQLFSRAPVCLACGTWLGDLRPVDFNSRCLHCDGNGCVRCADSGLPPQAAAVRWHGMRFPELLALAVDDAQAVFSDLEAIPAQERLLGEILRRLEALQRVGLGYITLNRPSPSLSRGEAQRVRLAIALVSRLEDMLHVLDEPTVGQHPADIQRLLPAFRDLAGPVVFVEHERLAAAQADHAIDLGPGAGTQGGRVIFNGTPQELWRADTPTGCYFSLREQSLRPDPRPEPHDFLTVHQATLRNLQGIDVYVPLSRLTVVTGVSGSGKSTLVEDVLVASLENGIPTGCRAVSGPALKPVLVDQSPIGRNPRSNPATYTKLADIVRDLFASASGLSPSHFSFNRPEGACPTCEGLGALEVSMRYLPPTWIPCADCGGQRFSEQVLEKRLALAGHLLSIADLYALTISEVCQILKFPVSLPEARRQSALRILAALEDIGLGYLSLGQPSPTLSGGEAQRVKLARYLGQKSLDRQLLVLDEPSTGLHPQDLAGLLAVLDRMVRAGATIVIVEHNLDVIRAADWVIDLGPGAGPHGGQLLYAGLPAGLIHVPVSLTGQAILAEAVLQPESAPADIETHRQPVIAIRSARAHNLQDVDVDIPKRMFTVVTGLSGSGKSSLVSDILESEARRRYLETLSMYERQGTHEGAQAEVGAISGLGVALTVTPERLVYSRRATVGSATEIAQFLAVLLAASNVRLCLECRASMQRTSEGWYCPDCHASTPLARPQHFNSRTYSAACIKCNGVGSLQVPQPKKLIIHPEKPLLGGAMYSPGFFPDGYLGKPYNHGYYMVQALAEYYGFDPFHTPWEAMSAQAQTAFLFGARGPFTVHVESRTGRSYTHQSDFPGFYGFIRDWDIGGTYTDTVPCPECHGACLRPEYLAVRLGGYNVHQLSQMSLGELAEVMEGIESDLSPLAGEAVVGVLRKIRQRLAFLIQVGLAYLHLDRVAGTLSAGEVQRIRLAGLLGSGLTSLTLLLDEPTRGLHPAEVTALIGALHNLRNEGNTVVVVEHDPSVMRAADYLIDMGPGAGRAGGQVVAQGRPQEVLQADTLTARWLREELTPKSFQPRRQPQRWMSVVGARANNLRAETIQLPLGVLAGVCGVSGSGKSTLVVDTLARALAPKKQTTSVAYEPVDPGAHDRIEGAPGRVLLVDQTRAGLSSPAAFLDLVPVLQTIFAESEDAHALGINRERLSARCSVCGGSGIIKMDMAFLPDVQLPCETCRGTGFLPEAWEVRLGGLALPEVFSFTLDQVYDLFGDDERIKRPLQSAREVGLGYLVLRQPGYALSGGEAQRLKIAKELCRPVPKDTLYILDEPTVGQHLEDVQRLISVLHRLVGRHAGHPRHSVIVVEHHPHLLIACDWLVELGPGGGPQGGWVVASGTPEQLANGATPIAPYLRETLKVAR